MIKQFILIILCFPFIVGATYYVASDGSGDFTTIAEVNAGTFQAGDRILFKKGDTWNDKLRISSSGSSGSNIVFSNYGSGDLPQILGIRTTDKSYIEIDGIYSWQNGSSRALEVYGGHDIYIKNCVFDGLKVPTDSPNLINIRWNDGSGGGTATYNEVYNLYFHNNIVKNAGPWNRVGWENYGGGLCFNTGSRDSEVIGNVVFDNVETDIQVFSALDSGYVNENIIISDNIVYHNSGTWTSQYPNAINIGWNTKNLIVSKNYVSGVYGTGIQADSLTSDSLIIDNVLYNSLEQIKILHNSVGNNYRQKIYNNTLISGDKTVVPIWMPARSGAVGSGHEVKNNIFYNSKNYWPMYSIEEGVTDLEIDNNLFHSYQSPTGYWWAIGGELYSVEKPTTNYYTLASLQAGTGYDLNSITSNPLLQVDYSLYPNSPAINAGADLSTYFTDDYTGYERKGLWDIGAYEYKARLTIEGLNYK